jgi:hypothetical protein
MVVACWILQQATTINILSTKELSADATLLIRSDI